MVLELLKNLDKPMPKKRGKVAKSLCPGDRVWLKPHSAYARGELERLVNIFTVSKTEIISNGRGFRVVVYTKERGERPTAFLRGSALVWMEVRKDG